MFLIFFEKTISGSGDSEALARGVKWVGMVGELSMISIGPLDQGADHVISTGRGMTNLLSNFKCLF